MPIDLSDREWPERVPGIGANLLHRGYVTEGQAVAMALGFPGMCEPIPADEGRVTALEVDDRQVVYGGTGGAKAHLFAGLTRGLTGAVLDMGVLQEEARVTAVQVARDGRVLATTAPGRQPGWAAGEGAIFVHESQPLPGDLIHEWHFTKTPAERAAAPLPGEGIGAAVLAPHGWGGELLVGIGESSGTLFTWDPATGETEALGPVDEHGLFARALVAGPDGVVYGTRALGELWCLDPMEGEIAGTGLFIPGVAGREVRNHADGFAVDPRRRIIYGGGTADGVLFAFDPMRRTVRSLGKPTCYRGARALAVTNDGRLFGISGREGDIGRLFCYDPDRHELRDLGMMASVLQERVYGCEFSCAATGRDGQIFLGECDRGGHLWIYWPAIKALDIHHENLEE